MKPYYQNAKQLSESHGLCIRTVRGLIAEIRQQEDRYGKYAILEGCGILVNIYVFYDYLKFRTALKDPNAKKSVPKFDPREVAEMCGGE
ncbi:MAG: hypothetical protein LUD72_07015 [Bacteroidales bacterium]|nr:hypothetical protein [Bacteroidales bacterium]